MSRNDAGIASIAASFGIGLGLGQGAQGMALEAAGMGRRAKPPVFPSPFPPGILTGTSVGSFLDMPDQFGPPMGWFWDITSLSLSGFTAGTVVVTRNAPYVTAAGTPYAVEVVIPVPSAGTVSFPQKGNPLLDGNDRLVFTVSAALTGNCAISGTMVVVPASRIDEYLS